MMTNHITFAQFRSAVRRKAGLALCLALCTLGLGLSTSAQEPHIITFDAPGADTTTGSFNGTFASGMSGTGTSGGACPSGAFRAASGPPPQPDLHRSLRPLRTVDPGIMLGCVHGIPPFLAVHLAESSAPNGSG